MTLDSDTRFVQVVKKRTTPKRRTLLHMGRKETLTHTSVCSRSRWAMFFSILGPIKTQVNVNDPSAGSPTETLLRLLLPLDDKV